HAFERFLVPSLLAQRPPHHPQGVCLPHSVTGLSPMSEGGFEVWKRFRLVAEEREDPAEVVAHQGFAVGQLLALDAGQRDLDQSAELIPPASRVERCEKYPGKRRAQRRT